LARALAKVIELEHLTKGRTRYDVVVNSWFRLVEDDDRHLFDDYFVKPVFEFCKESTEGDIVIHRLFNWRNWFKSWGDDAEAVLKDERWLGNSLLKDIAISFDSKIAGDEPIFLFNGVDKDEGHLVTWTNIAGFEKEAMEDSPFPEFADGTASSLSLAVCAAAIASANSRRLPWPWRMGVRRWARPLATLASISAAARR
jgi:hypothetical protein